jgi:HK97 family phage major capsid protein
MSDRKDRVEIPVSRLNELAADVKDFVGRANKELGRVDQIQRQLDALDIRVADRGGYGGAAPPSWRQKLAENESVQRLLRDGKGRGYFKLEGADLAGLLSRKNIISAAASGTSEGDTLGPLGTAATGVLQIDRIPGITIEPRQALKVRDVLTARPTSLALVDFVKVSTPLAIASPVVEASTKPENSLVFTSLSEKVRTIATWIPATKQVLADFDELSGFVSSSMPYYVNLAEEIQLLSGDGTGENLHGLIVQAAAFNTSLLATAEWTRLDIIGRAIEQIMAAKELDPTFVVLHPNDYWAIRLTKDGFGRYILGDPQNQSDQPRIFGLDLVYTTSIAAGTFLIGSGNPIASEIRDRMELMVEISTEHADYFTRNLVAIRAEKRLALIVKRPNSYVTGSFATSPAS